MSMNPEVHLVLGVKVVSHQEEEKILKGRKYREDTGDPYDVFDTRHYHAKPEWFAKAFKSQDESDEPWVEDSELGIVRISDDEETFIVGKLLKTIDPRSFGAEDVFSLDMQELLATDRCGVMEFIRELGATEFSMEDIKLWISTEWG